jgi:hypothetical protein
VAQVGRQQTNRRTSLSGLFSEDVDAFYARARDAGDEEAGGDGASRSRPGTSSSHASWDDVPGPGTYFDAQYHTRGPGVSSLANQPLSG